MVDNRRYHRLAYCVLEHDPTQDDVRAFLSAFQGQLDKRGLSVRGLTTDGSPLYPKVLKELWPEVPHQLCRFHVLKEITKAVLRALAKLRKEWKAQIPKQRRGRPRQQEKAQARRLQRRKQRVAELFEHRHLFVRHYLSASQKKLLKKLVRGQPQLRALREIMDEVYRLFDRRCKTATALRRLEKLRQRVRRCKRLARALGKLNSPNLEKALLFLDDKLLGSTSNAVERSNRRFRKAQKSIYSVRTKRHIEQRLALDLNRELRAAKHARTLKTLHRARSDPEFGHCCCYSVNVSIGIIIAIGRDHALAVRAEGYTEDIVGVAPQLVDHPAARHLPDPDRPVMTARGQLLAVRAEGHAADPAGVALEGERFLTARQVPDLDRRVPTGRGQLLAVWAERHAADRAGLAAEGERLLAVGRVPDFHFPDHGQLSAARD